MAFVLDASVAVARLAPDELLSPSISEAVESERVVVPALWPFEVANALEVMRRRGRLDEPAVSGAKGFLRALAPEIDPVSPERCWGGLSELARMYRLSGYDAAYLELAGRRKLPLATLDEALGNAARLQRLELL